MIHLGHAHQAAGVQLVVPDRAIAAQRIQQTCALVLGVGILLDHQDAIGIDVQVVGVDDRVARVAFQQDRELRRVAGRVGRVHDQLVDAAQLVGEVRAVVFVAAAGGVEVDHTGCVAVVRSVFDADHVERAGGFHANVQVVIADGPHGFAGVQHAGHADPLARDGAIRLVEVGFVGLARGRGAEEVELTAHQAGALDRVRRGRVLRSDVHVELAVQAGWPIFKQHDDRLVAGVRAARLRFPWRSGPCQSARRRCRPRPPQPGRPSHRTYRPADSPRPVR